ncbi:MAG TPA: hypothetical protein VGH43_03015 [Jatrophihabitans sp.]
MSALPITIEVDTASDSWGFVGVVKVGKYEAYRTIESFATPAEAEQETQAIVGGVLGEMLAGAEWRRVRETTGATPTRRDLSLSVLKRSHAPAPPPPG